MKKLFIALLVSTCMLSSCSKDNTGELGQAHIDISSKTIFAGPKGLESEIKVISSGDWRISGVSDWVRPAVSSGHNGDTVKFTVDPNTTAAEREATFKFFTGSAVVVLKVTSELGNNLQLVSEPKITLPRSKGSFVVKLKTNVADLATSFSGDGAQWIKFDSRTETFGMVLLNFTIGENETYDNRSTSLTIAGEGLTEEVAVMQKPVEGLEMDETRLEYDLTARDISIVVKTNMTYHVMLEDAWITQLPETRGLEVKTLRFHLDKAESTRGGKITILGGDITKSVNVLQRDPDANVISISDVSFRKWLASRWWIIDLGGDSCIAAQAGLDAKELNYQSDNWDDPSVKSLAGIEAFVNLESIRCQGQGLTVVDISALKKVNKLSFGENALSLLILGDNPVETLSLPSLHSFDMGTWENHFTENLVVSSTKLKNLELVVEDEPWYDDELETLDVSDCPALETLNCKRKSGVLKTIYLKQGQTIPNMTYTEGAQILYK